MSHTADDWRRALNHMDGAGWEEPADDMEEALVAAYNLQQIDHNGDIVAAAVEAAAKMWASWSPEAFTDLARAFMTYYDDMTEVRQQHLDEHYEGTEVSWFKDDAPVWGGVISDDEIYAETDSGVFFFAKPGTSRYATLTKSE